MSQSVTSSVKLWDQNVHWNCPDSSQKVILEQHKHMSEMGQLWRSCTVEVKGRTRKSSKSWCFYNDPPQRILIQWKYVCNNHGSVFTRAVTANKTNKTTSSFTSACKHAHPGRISYYNYGNLRIKVLQLTRVTHPAKLSEGCLSFMEQDEST